MDFNKFCKNDRRYYLRKLCSARVVQVQITIKFTYIHRLAVLYFVYWEAKEQQYLLYVRRDFIFCIEILYST